MKVKRGEGSRTKAGKSERSRSSATTWQGAGTDGRWHTCEPRQRRAVNMAGHDKPDPRMLPDDLCKLIGVAEVLTVHVPYPCENGG
jgi:hypothetical protein